MAIDVLTVGEGQLYPRVYGTHIINGHLLVQRTTPPVTVLVALGVGVWDGVDTLWYKGEPLPIESYHFHPGIPSSGLTDPVQGVDSWLPGGLTYSGVAYIVAQLPEEDPDLSQLIGRYRCLKIDDYDENGNLTGTGFSANPARVAADLMLRQAKLRASRINWPSWKRWRDMCDEAIAWDDGATIHSIPRFTAHQAFTQGVSVDSALRLLCDLSASNWQDDGKEIRFVTPFERTPVFEFNDANIVSGSVTVEQADQRTSPNRIQIQFRNLQNEYLAPASWLIESEIEIEQRGIVDLGTVNFGPMTYSQAQRIGHYLLRTQGSSSMRLSFEAASSSYSVLPADIATFKHWLVSDSSKEILTLETSDQLSSADTRLFVGAVIDAPLYSDSDHEPIPANLVLPNSQPGASRWLSR